MRDENGRAIFKIVLEEWFEREVRSRMKGRCFLTRFADDFVIGCEREDDARRIMAVLPKRVARFGLTIHPQKTVLVSFLKPVSHVESGPGNGTLELLGLTHDWTKSRRGSWVIKWKTASQRLRREMKALWQWCRDQRHTPLKVQHRLLCQKLRGHYQYYGIRGNYPRLEQLYEHAEHAWRYWLSRRSRQSAIPWAKFDWLRVRYPLPTPTLVYAI
jgi:RNA-directed DNA polymerase